MGDIKLLAAATVAVLLVGFFIAGAILVTTRGGGGVQCSTQLNIGLASGVRDNLDHGPYFQTGGGDCGFWLALQNSDIVAYKAVQPTGCTLQLKLDHWACDSRTVPVSGLAQYPISIQTVNGVDAVIVNLGTVPSTSNAG